MSSAQDPRSFFQSDLYIRHNARRLEHLASLHLDLAGKTVLELGAGIGDHTVFFLDRGCSVTAIEPRQANVETLRARMHGLPGVWDPARLQVHQADVQDLDRMTALGTFDVVHHYGLLYHLQQPVAALAQAASRCHGILLLETKVRLPDREPALMEDPDNPTNSIDGAVTLLTRDEILAALGDLFPYVYEPIFAVPHEQFPADWRAVPATQWPIRMTAVGARTPLGSPYLSRHHGVL